MTFLAFPDAFYASFRVLTRTSGSRDAISIGAVQEDISSGSGPCQSSRVTSRETHFRAQMAMKIELVEITRILHPTTRHRSTVLTRTSYIDSKMRLLRTVAESFANKKLRARSTRVSPLPQARFLTRELVDFRH